MILKYGIDFTNEYFKDLDLDLKLELRYTNVKTVFRLLN